MKLTFLPPTNQLTQAINPPVNQINKQATTPKNWSLIMNNRRPQCTDAQEQTTLPIE